MAAKTKPVRTRTRAAGPFSLSMTLASNRHEVSRIEGFLKTVRRKISIEAEVFDRLFVATTEAVTNAIIHGNKQDPSKHVQITVEGGAGMIHVTVLDEGTGFDPDNLPDPLDNANLLKESGRGVFLIRHLMDEAEFSPAPSGTKLVMKISARKKKKH